MFVFKKFQISLGWFNFFFALVTVTLYNRVFFARVSEIYPGWPVTFATACVLVLALNIIYNLLFYRRTAKFLAVILTLINALVLYFMINYNAVIDKVMLLNIIQTDAYEVEDLLGANFFYYVGLFGVLPALVIVFLPIDYTGYGWRKRLSGMVLSALLAGGIIGVGYKTAEDLMRNHKPIRYALVPSNYIGSAISVAKMQKKNSSHPFVKIAGDAVRNDYWTENGKKNLFIFIVGETARAASFSLNGYERPTNEPLEPYAGQLLYFSDVTSCGTSTAVSVPCMFSKDGRRNFKPGSEDYTENFLDILERLDFKVFWRENNTGCKGNCDRVEVEDVCLEKSCYDKVLMDNLEQHLQKFEEDDIFVVFHQKGVHGPSYIDRYPAEFARWQPVCTDKVNVKNCTREELVNVYDNATLYGSQVLADYIRELERLGDRYNTFLIYASDHGESLGEDNFYLHGHPYDEAPDYQKHIPMLIWMSDSFAESFKIDRACLKSKLAEPHSHDNLFHSMLGLTGIKTGEYNPDLDIFADCRIK